MVGLDSVLDPCLDTGVQEQGGHPPADSPARPESPIGQQLATGATDGKLVDVVQCSLLIAAATGRFRFTLQRMPHGPTFWSWL